MTVSIIMPAFNAENTLGQAIDSVLSQSFQDWELIIVNDCSRDKTGEIINEYAERDPRIRVLTNEKNMGASRSRHRAVCAAQGSMLAFLDSDDLWTPLKLEKQTALAQNGKKGIIFTGSAFIYPDGSRARWLLHVPGETDFRSLLKQNLISNSSVLVDRESYVKYEIVGDKLHEDFACWLNMLRAGVRAYGIDEPLLIYRLSPNSKSGNKLKSAVMNWNTYRRIGLDFFSALYYMLRYAVRGLKKYSKLRK